MTITKLLTLEQAADYIGVSRSTARRYRDREVNPLPVRIMGGRKMFKKQDLDEWKKIEDERKGRING